MRTVRDPSGATWICLELPEVPVEQRPAEALAAAPVVAIECNSGAHRAIALVSPGWDEALDDAALLAVIQSALRPPATP
jgi:hypothetical protein